MLRTLLSDANDVAGTLAERGPQVNALLVDGNALLGELDRRQAALGEVITNISALSTQLSGLVHDNEAQLQPVLGKLDTVVGILQNNKDNLSQGIDGLGTYVARSVTPWPAAPPSTTPTSRTWCRRNTPNR